MTALQWKLIAGAAIVLASAMLVTAVRSHFRIVRLETSAARSITAAQDADRRSQELETETYIYKEKAAGLEQELAAQRARAEKQNEELKKLSADTDAARRELQRHRDRAN
jgi:hypothetical protein